MTWKKHSLRATLFLLLVVAVLSPSSVFETTGHSSQLSDSGKSIKQEPIFSPLKFGIGNANATVVIYPSFYQIRLLIQYIGGDEPLLQDSILVPKNFELVDVRPVESDLDVIATVTTLDNQSIVSLNFSRFLFPSEILNVLIIGNIYLDNSESFVRVPIWWNYSQPAGTENTRILLFPGIDYANSNPKPSRIRSTTNGFLELWWINIFTSGFTTILSVVVTQVARNEILVSPSPIYLTTSSENAFVRLFLANIGTTAVNITFTLPRGTKFQKSFLVLKAFEQESIDLLLFGDKSGEIRGKIEIYTNRTSVPITIPVQIELRKASSSSNTALLITIGLFLALLTTIGVGFFYHNRFRKENLPLLLPEDTETLSSSNALIGEQAVIQSLKEIKARIGDRRASILEYIYQNPGCSQQEVAEKLGFSKATISREIQKLGAQGYIAKKRRGMSHQLFLTSKIMNKRR